MQHSSGPCEAELSRIKAFIWGAFTCTILTWSLADLPTPSVLNCCLWATFKFPGLSSLFSSPRHLRHRSFAIKFSPLAKLTPNRTYKPVQVYYWSCCFCFSIFCGHLGPSSQAGLFCCAPKAGFLGGTKDKLVWRDLSLLSCQMLRSL